jgi:hypothetical protein
MSKRYINGQMVEVTDTNTQAVLRKLHPQPADENDLTAEQLAEAIAQGEAALERFRAAERARHDTRTYRSDALGTVTIPEDDE